MRSRALRAEQALQEQIAIIEALEAREADAAERVTREHTLAVTTHLGNNHQT